MMAYTLVTILLYCLAFAGIVWSLKGAKSHTVNQCWCGQTHGYQPVRDPSEPNPPNPPAPEVHIVRVHNPPRPRGHKPYG
jgi:hypothetical protein